MPPGPSLRRILAAFFLVFGAASSATNALDLAIGQMILAGIGERKVLGADDPLRKDLASGLLGGVVLFDANLRPTDARDDLKALLRDLRACAREPLFLGIDEEGGLVHRLDARHGFFDMPSAEETGRFDPARSTFPHALRLATLLADLGFNLNFAPVADLATRRENPVISRQGRSYGWEPERVTAHARAFLDAHRSKGVLTVLKHFPGHGSSWADSHRALPDVTDSWWNREFEPYLRLLAEGRVDAVMAGHIVNRRMDSSGLPASLSSVAIEEWLRKRLGFDGVVFSDDLQMGAIVSTWGVEKATELAILAGADVLVYGNTDPEASFEPAVIHGWIRRAVESGRVPASRIEASARRIRALKARWGAPAAP